MTLYKFKVYHNNLIYAYTAKGYYVLLLNELSLDGMESIFQDAELQKKMSPLAP